ncbi:MAG: [FeFe] hydrogenase H-cluster maturation GTPase HydF [Candidatus Omnitrophica bacterium]|nr:[FeFe] hydrogenase H-cluster maturation GTPase HydF [Candidatus Omnitrophota bacterium]
MFKTPKSIRLQIGIFGRTNVGKSTFLNYITNQDVSITSEIPGTTTDVVEKAMELLPIGPVLFLDTAGLDDRSELSSLRLKKTGNIFERSDIFVLVIEAGIWTAYEERIINESKKNNAPVIIVVNKSDINRPDDDFLDRLKQYSGNVLVASCTDKQNQNFAIHDFKRRMIEILPLDFLNPPSIVGDLMPRGGVAVLIVPIDKEAPKGRIILPQVQTIRDTLDNGQMSLSVKETEYELALKKLKQKPDLVVCDSQVVDKMVAATPEGVKCTTFSMLFSRIKGDLSAAVDSLAVIKELGSGDKVLIAESCSHHPIEDDIGRVKIPRWFKKYTGKDILFEDCAGRDFPETLEEYKLVIQCGGCMITRREMLARVERAKAQGVPLTNYGVCISFLHGVLERVISPFPDAEKRFYALNNVC